MLKSQFDVLEEPQQAIEIDISKSSESIIGDVIDKINAVSK
jgi:gluconate kinase